MANVSLAQEQLAARLTGVRERIADAARGCGRSPDEVKLIAIRPAAILSASNATVGLSRHRNATTTASAANVKPVDLSEGGRTTPLV